MKDIKNKAVTIKEYYVKYLQNRALLSRKQQRRMNIALMMLLFSLLGPSNCFGFLFCSHLKSFKGKVIDAETKQPIEGAVVLVVYYNTTHTIAGSNSYEAHGRETVTDAKGEFEIPSQCKRIKDLDFVPSAKPVIFKPGYGTFPRHRRSEAVGENKSWPPSGKYIVYELPRLKTKAERIRSLPNSYSEIPYNYKKQYIKLINIERKALGAKTFFSESQKEQ